MTNENDKPRIMLSCSDVAELFGVSANCCESCHTDVDEGYYDSMSGEGGYANFSWDVCRSVGREIKGKAPSKKAMRKMRWKYAERD